MQSFNTLSHCKHQIIKEKNCVYAISDHNELIARNKNLTKKNSSQ